MQDLMLTLDAINHVLGDYGRMLTSIDLSAKNKATLERRVARLRTMKADTEARIADLRQVRAA